MESQARGGTRWRRFGAVMVPSVAATAAIGVALAQGALAASFTVSGQSFKVTTDKLVNEDGFVQYGTVNTTADGKHVPVAVSAFNSATIYNLCQSVVVPTPIGDVTLRLGAGADPDQPVQAENLFIDVAQLDADAEFTNIDIGVPAGGTSKGPDPTGPYDPNSFAQQADKVTLTDVKQTAWATTAGTFKLSGLKLNLHRGNDKQCY
ncbi:DUF6230 family protein [Streptomyces aidingensis]|uniref:Cholesterol esterase n=1 Tax=Streptomyces aidingensis TaxID=910347 RepID=A0A1I1T034_9ACTN|nr:DUF6230 family protein [Streptomyces aidingensis]SFD49563.1 hypothetical protein SAMN05421773_11727 [Streptomyces aidingensis]